MIMETKIPKITLKHISDSRWKLIHGDGRTSWTWLEDFLPIIARSRLNLSNKFSSDFCTLKFQLEYTSGGHQCLLGLIM